MLYQLFIVLIAAGAVHAQLLGYQATGQASARKRDQKQFGANIELGPFELDGQQGVEMRGNKMVVSQTGVYYVYGQVHYIHLNAKGQLYNRCILYVNNKPFRYLQKGMDGRADIGNVYSGGLIHLRSGDTISLKTQQPSRINLDPRVTFFGAFRVGYNCQECSVVVPDVKSYYNKYSG